MPGHFPTKRDRLVVAQRNTERLILCVTGKDKKNKLNGYENNWGMGSFKKYVTVEGWGVCAIFVTNCYEKCKGWGGGCQVTLVTQRQKYLVNVSLFHFLMNVPWCLMH